MKYIKKYKKFTTEKRIMLRLFKNHDYLKYFLRDIKSLINSTDYYGKMGIDGFIDNYTVETLISWFAWNSSSLTNDNRDKIHRTLNREYNCLKQGT